MKFGILFNDSKVKNKDFSSVRISNPGVGGTEYCYLMLMSYIQEVKDIELIVYTYSNNCNNQYPCGVVVKNFPSKVECILKAKEDCVDVMLINFTEIEEVDREIRKCKLATIVWVHNLINANTVNFLNINPYYKRVILLGNEHYERYIDHDFIKKCVIIPNMVSVPDTIRDSTQENNVVYTGALVKSKGFHSVAKAWKKVVREVPDAQLYVIGTGKLYDNTQMLGKMNIAESRYENEFIPFLLNADGELLDSVHFLGLLGPEKVDIYKKAKVGVVNPTAKTEVCPISVLEMAALGIPVISKKKNGVPDTIKNNETGLLISSESELAKTIITLLTDNKLNKKLGDSARNFVISNFSPEIILERWVTVLKDVVNCKISCTYHRNKVYYLANDFKWLKLITRMLRFDLKLRFIPSIVELEYYMKKLIKGDSNL